MRADQKLVVLGLAESRSRAQTLIKAGAVLCDGVPVKRASSDIPEAARLELDPAAAAAALPYVSRGGLKLARALEAFDLSPEGAVALDLGASTGGFTEVLLQRGAALVYAVDVGTGQLAPSISADPRVIELSGLNAKALRREHVPREPTFLVADLSFISLLKALPTPLSLMADRAVLAVLVKPQFEVGREAVGKGGVVKDAEAQARALDAVCSFLQAEGWRILGTTDSPILGSDGNREFLLAATRER